MRIYVRTIEEKHELEAKGHKCIEMKRVFVNGVLQEYYDWGFEVPENVPVEVKTEKQPDPEKRRGNPNWVKRAK